MKTYCNPTATVLFCEDADLLTVSIGTAGEGLKVSWSDLDQVQDL